MDLSDFTLFPPDWLLLTSKVCGCDLTAAYLPIRESYWFTLLCFVCLDNGKLHIIEHNARKLTGFLAKDLPCDFDGF